MNVIEEMHKINGPIYTVHDNFITTPDFADRILVHCELSRGKLLALASYEENGSRGWVIRNIIGKDRECDVIPPLRKKYVMLLRRVIPTFTFNQHRRNYCYTLEFDSIHPLRFTRVFIRTLTVLYLRRGGLERVCGLEQMSFPRSPTPPPHPLYSIGLNAFPH
ncbi:hypothetical protein V6N13_093338 [Hibiscus sabdariffa]